MSKGYLLFALDNNDTSYSKLALACALSIKITQPKDYNSIAVVTNNVGYFDKDLFDYIIPAGSLQGMDARSRAYDLSPYDETVLLDSDMLFLKPMDHCWQLVKDLDLFISSTPQSYKAKAFQYGYYRKLFLENSWPDIYSAWTYFKKSAQAEEFFNLVKSITDNPTEYVDAIIPKTAWTSIPTDEAMALSLIILDLVDSAVFPHWDWPRITHMKPAVQNWRAHVNDWHEKLRFSVDQQGQVKLGVWQQAELLHYVKKELITDDVIGTLKATL